MRRLCTLALAALLSSPAAQAQDVRYTFEGDAIYDLFGITADARPDFDVDGDGHPDCVVGGYRGGGFLGRVAAFSGRDGSVLHYILGASGEALGAMVAAGGDVDGDGHDDLLSINLHGTAYVHSGSDASLLFTFPDAHSSIADWGDLDGDGHDDVLVANHVRSGANGSILRTLAGGSGYWWLRLAGDVDGDAVQDYVVVESPELRVHAGADDALLYTLPAKGWVAVGTGGDLDADGNDDLLGAYFAGSRFDLAAYSGRDGLPLLRYQDVGGLTETVASQIIDFAGDADGDGHDDFLVGGWTPRLYSGRTGCVLAELRADTTTAAQSVASLGDADGDGNLDVLVGFPAWLGPKYGGGTAVLFRYNGRLGTNYCSSGPTSSGQPAVISASGSASIARNNLLLTASGLPHGEPAIFYYGGGPAEQPFGNGSRCVQAGGVGIFRLPVTFADLNGCLRFAVDNTAPPAPAGALTAGSTWFFQAWFRDPFGGGAFFDLSDGLELTFQP